MTFRLKYGTILLENLFEKGSKKLKKHLLYNLFNGNRDREDAKWEDTNPNLKYFFKLLGRKFWKLISLNFLMLPMVVPVLIAVFLYIGIDTTPTQQTPLFAPLYGANIISASEESTFLLDLFGVQFLVPSYNATGTYIGIGACILFLLITFGWQNIGSTYVLRGLVRGDAVFLFSDYFYAIKRNWKQGFFLGLIDFIILFLLGFDILFFSFRTGSFGMDFMFFASCALLILYFFMRFYLYLLQITFHLSIRKILKNALIFTTLGIKRNLMGTLGIVVLTLINVGLIIIIAPTGGVIGVGLILPLLHYLAISGFISTYAAYPVIDRYMIAPYRNTAKDDNASSEDSSLQEPEDSDSVKEQNS